MQVNLRVNSVLKNAVCCDIDVVKAPGNAPAARGTLQISVIKVGLN
jgi:hypothetical protein